MRARILSTGADGRLLWRAHSTVAPTRSAEAIHFAGWPRRIFVWHLIGQSPESVARNCLLRHSMRDGEGGEGLDFAQIQAKITHLLWTRGCLLSAGKTRSSFAYRLNSTTHLKLPSGASVLIAFFFFFAFGGRPELVFCRKSSPLVASNRPETLCALVDEQNECRLAKFARPSSSD